MAARVAFHADGRGPEWQSGEVRREGRSRYIRMGGAVCQVKVAVLQQLLVRQADLRRLKGLPPVGVAGSCAAAAEQVVPPSGVARFSATLTLSPARLVVAPPGSNAG